MFIHNSDLVVSDKSGSLKEYLDDIKCARIELTDEQIDKFLINQFDWENEDTYLVELDEEIESISQ